MELPTKESLSWQVERTQSLNLDGCTSLHGSFVDNLVQSPVATSLEHINLSGCIGISSRRSQTRAKVSTDPFCSVERLQAVTKRRHSNYTQVQQAIAFVGDFKFAGVDQRNYQVLHDLDQCQRETWPYNSIKKSGADRK